MTLDTAKHKNILVKILKDIYTDPSISPILGFKGGTAATLFYNLDRFSVDLDFDLLDSEKEDYVFEHIQRILGKYGVVKQARKKRFNLLYILAYSDKDINTQNVKVEINRRKFGSQYTIRSFLGISMQVMVQEDMAAHKLCAMYEQIVKLIVTFLMFNFSFPTIGRLIQRSLRIVWVFHIRNFYEKLL